MLKYTPCTRSAVGNHGARCAPKSTSARPLRMQRLHAVVWCLHEHICARRGHATVFEHGPSTAGQVTYADLPQCTRRRTKKNEVNMLAVVHCTIVMACTALRGSQRKSRLWAEKGFDAFGNLERHMLKSWQNERRHALSGYCAFRGGCPFFCCCQQQCCCCRNVQ